MLATGAVGNSEEGASAGVAEGITHQIKNKGNQEGLVADLGESWSKPALLSDVVEEDDYDAE